MRTNLEQPISAIQLSHPRLVDERDRSNCGGNGRARSEFAAAVGTISATEGSAAPDSAACRGDSKGTRLQGDTLDGDGNERQERGGNDDTQVSRERARGPHMDADREGNM